MTIRAERVHVVVATGLSWQWSRTCTWCHGQRYVRGRTRTWLYRFHDSGARCSGPIADGKLFCSRDCLKAYGAAQKIPDWTT